MSGSPPIGAAALAVVLLMSSAGCACFSESAARYGHAEETAATQIIPLGSLAYKLCRKDAEYRYLLELLGDAKPGPGSGEPWSIWYREAKARPGPGGTIVTWETQCNEYSQAGQVVIEFLRALRAHARAIEAVAESKDFDASGIAKTGDAIATQGGKLGLSTGYSAAVQKASGIAPAVVGKIVDLARDKELANVVADSDACMQGAFSHLHDVGAALAVIHERISGNRLEIISRLRVARREPKSAAAAALADAFDVVGEDAVELEALGTGLVEYRAAIDQLSAAHHALAELADGRGSRSTLEGVLAQLALTEETLLELEQR